MERPAPARAVLLRKSLREKSVVSLFVPLFILILLVRLAGRFTTRNAECSTLREA